MVNCWPGFAQIESKCMNSYVVVVDFSHLFHVCWAVAQKAPPHYDVVETTRDHIIGKLRTVKAELKKQNVMGYDLVFAEDREATRKLALLPGYREGREDLSVQKNAIKQYLLQNGAITRFCHSEGNEADDVIATLVRMVNEQDGYATVVVSSDRDLWQLIGPKVRIFNPVRQDLEFVTPEHVERAFRCKPIHIPLYKALWGDPTDCVPNIVPRMQKQLLPIIHKTDGTLESFISRIEGEDRFYLTSRCFDLYTQGKARIEVNWQVVKLDNQCELTWE